MMDDKKRFQAAVEDINLSGEESARIWDELDERMKSYETNHQRKPRSRSQQYWMTGFAAAAAVCIAIGGTWSALHLSKAGPKPVGVSATNKVTSEHLAVFDSKTLDSLHGAPLYTILGSSDDTSQWSTHLIDEHANWARFSGDGKWIAITTDSTSTGSTSPNPTLWIISSDGKQKQKVPGLSFHFGSWMANSNAFVYGEPHAHHLYVVKPNTSKVLFDLATPKNAEVSDIKFSPDGRYAAVLFSVDAPNPQDAHPDFAHWHDEIVIRDLSTKSQKVLVSASSQNGLVLGPWASDSQSVFYWDDPQHSASILADGTMLHQVDLSGGNHAISVALVAAQTADIANTVVPMGSGDAAIQLGGGRELFTNKSIGLWKSGTLVDLPKQPNEVQLSPSASSDGSKIAFVSAPELKSYPTSTEYEAWRQSMKLYVYSSVSDEVRAIDKAGTGVRLPMMTTDGSRILYLKGTDLWAIDAGGITAPKKIATLPAGNVSIADYLSIVK